VRQNGFVLPSPTMLLAGALGVALLVAFVQTLRLDSEQKAFALFKIQVQTLGDEQNRKTAEAEARHRELVKEKDNENATAHAALAAVSKRLRDRDSRRGLVPPATPGSSRPDLACYNRAELDDALRAFTGSVGELVIEGESATIDLNTAKSWVGDLRRKALGSQPPAAPSAP
jgi:hypothetical protein